MRSLSLKNLLSTTVATMALAACSGSGDIANSGSPAPVTVNVGGGTGPTTGTAINLIPSGVTCPVGTAQKTETVGGADVTACFLPAGTLKQDIEIPANTGLGIEGSVFVGDNLITNPSGATATLKLNAGVTVFGTNGEDAIFVSPGSKIDAQGTANNPIVMTSANDIADGNVNDTISGTSSSARGEWGGLVISGLAPINDCDDATAAPGTAACVKTGEGGSGVFGGANPNDNSGTLRYVRVQYAGFKFNDEDELNGIAFQGVGDGTIVDYVQVHNNKDDGVEFFGGTVDASHIVVTGAGDDSIDWTDGWTGDLQYAVVVHADDAADRGIEGDNRGGDNDVLPRSNPNISNFTFFGSSSAGSDGIKMREGTSGSVANGIIIGFAGGDGVDFDTVSAPSLNSILVSGNGAPFDSAAAPFFTGGANNTDTPGNTMSGLIPGPTETAVSATDISVGNDLVAENFIGAFDPATETNANNWTTGWTIAGSLPTGADLGCPTGTTQSANSIPAAWSGPEVRICTLPSVITSDMTLTKGLNLYEIAGAVFVGGDVGADANAEAPGVSKATLTIEAGVTLFGSAGEDALFVSRGSKISANGTAAAPITLTSLNDIDGTVTATTRGAWGGLVINGRAPINDCNDASVVPTTNPELCEKTGEGGSGLFGGNKADDDSGNLNYVVVKYAGFKFNDEDELNGIAFQGVGSGTEVDYVQVHNNKDDGVEFFGGTVAVSHLVITNAGDDSIDWTDGWQGSLQYSIVVQGGGDGDRAIEADNRSGDNEIEPRSNPTLSNLTLVGYADTSDVIKLREGTNAQIYNTIVTGAPNGDGIDFDASVSNLVQPTFFSTYVVDNATSLKDIESGMFETSNGNKDGDAASESSTLTASGTTAALVPGANELAVSPTAAPNLESTTYIGAVENAADNWYKGWTFGL